MNTAKACEGKTGTVVAVDIRALGAGDYGACPTKEELKKTAAISVELGKALFNSINLSLGVGQGIGASGSIKLGSESLSAALQTSANYAEIRLDNGKIEIGMSRTNEASIGVATGKIGAAQNETSDWNGNWTVDESTSFVGVAPTTSIGISGSLYFIVGFSFNLELDLNDIINQTPQVISNIKEIMDDE